MGSCMSKAPPTLDPGVQAILDKIKNEEKKNTGSPTTTKLREETKQFLHTAQQYLECRKQMDAKYNEVDPNGTLTKWNISTDSGGIRTQQKDEGSKNSNSNNKTINPMPTYKKEYQQQSISGSPVNKLAELYDAAKPAQKVYQEIIQQLVDKVCKACQNDEDKCDNDDTTTTAASSGVHLQFAPLKGRVRAQEKAEDDYSDRVPGPGASWLYDIVRGSVQFATLAQMVQCLECIQADPNLHIVKAKNRFQTPTLTGYRDFNLCLRITTPQNYCHICEVQIHLGALKQLSIALNSHKHYEYFRSYFDGSTDSLEDRLEDLQLIVQEHAKDSGSVNNGSAGGPLDEGLLQRLLDKSTDEERIDRLGDLFQEYLCEYDWSLRAYAKLLDIRLDKYNVHHPSVASTLKEMAKVLQHQRRLEESIIFYEQCLHTQKRGLGEANLQVADTFCSMAQVLRMQGKTGYALAFLEQGLELQQTSLGEENIPVANTYNTMGGVYFNNRELDRAMGYFQKSLSIYINVIGEDHKYIANTYNNMALIQVDKKEYDSAMKKFEECLDIQKRTLGEEHATIATTYSNIGDVYVHKSDADTAMEYYQKSVDIKQKTLGEDHPSVANIYRNMAKALKQNGEITEAMEMEKKHTKSKNRPG